MPTQALSLASPDIQDSEIFFEHSYYAIKSLELLVNYLGLGEVYDLSFNKAALYNYIFRNTHEDDSTLYFKPQYTDDIETILENTYYMVYVLKTLNLYDLNSQKIQNFVLQNIDYANIKNIYYSFKISELLDLGIDFNIELTSSLVDTLYSEELNEYYQNTDLRVICQNAFLWVTDIAMNDAFEIDCNYKKSLYLGGVNTISVSFSNMIFTRFDQYFTVHFESQQFGVLVLEEQFDNTYQINFMIPEDPLFYPSVNGVLKIYHYSRLLDVLSIDFQTTYNLNTTKLILKDDANILFEYNISYQFSSGNTPADSTRVYAMVYREDVYYETENFTREDFSEYSKFILDYNYSDNAEYTFNISMVDIFNPNGLNLYNVTRSSDLPSNHPIPIPVPTPDPIPTPPSNEPNIDWLVTSLIISLGLFLVVAVVITTKLIKKRKKSTIRSENFEGKNQNTPLLNPIYDNLGQSIYNGQINQVDLSRKNNIDYNSFMKDDISQAKINNNKSAEKEQKKMKEPTLKNYIIGLVKENKKETFWVTVGIIMFLVLYFYGRDLIAQFIFCGVIIIVIGIILRYINSKIGGRVMLVGALIAGFGLFIFVLKILELWLILIF